MPGETSIHVVQPPVSLVQVRNAPDLPQLTYSDLEKFFEGLVDRLRRRGVTCAITSGMACVHFGVASTTKDCDALCAPDSAESFLALLSETLLSGSLPCYRGNLSPPLDGRWLRGGWTSHFFWKSGADDAYLDVFGVAPRATTPWEQELAGLYASPHTVAEMKRTDRDKDWPYVTALGANMLQSGDPRGWLHIFDHDLLMNLVEKVPIPQEVLAQRPSLDLAVSRDERLKPVLRVEREYWEEIDRGRINVYQCAIRPYMSAMRKSRPGSGAGLLEQHQVRVSCAEQHLAASPILDHGVDRLLSDARNALSRLFASDLLDWLPDARDSFKLLSS